LPPRHLEGQGISASFRFRIGQTGAGQQKLSAHNHVINNVGIKAFFGGFLPKNVYRACGQTGISTQDGPGLDRDS
jgi:hypothetical protein